MKQKVSFGPVLWGWTVTAAVCLVLCGVCSAMILSGILGEGAMPVLGWLVTALGCFFGAVTAAGKSGTKKLPMALIAVGLYVLSVFILRGICFGSAGERAWITALIALMAGVLGALAGTGKKQRRRRG